MARAAVLDRQAMTDMGFYMPDAAPPVAPPVQKKKPKTLQKIAPVSRDVKKLKVACYGRISTLHEEQEGSLEVQESHFRKMVEANDEWECAGVFLDRGISGTHAGTRPALQNLLDECRKGTVDLVLTKSLSRFARNCTECLQMIRELNALHVEVLFEKERIRTGTLVSDFMLSVMACLAEEESHSISGNIKWGVKKRFRDGTYKPALDPYGYRREGSVLRIVPEEASVVREVFSGILSGYGLEAISKALNERGVRTRKGCAWSAARIGDMVHNPVYCGDRLYQRTYKDETFKQVKNNGEMDQYYDEGCHAGIVDSKTFEKVQEVLEKRFSMNGGEKKRRITAFGGKIICGKCGKPMRRRTDNATSAYRCITEGCSCNVKDGSLRAAFITIMNKLAYSERTRYPVVGIFLDKTRENRLETVSSRIAEIEDAVKRNEEKAALLEAAAAAPGYGVSEMQEANCLRQEAGRLAKELSEVDGNPGYGLLEAVRRWEVKQSVDEFPVNEFLSLVEKIVVKEKAEFHFKCGLVLEEDVRPHIPQTAFTN